MKQKGWVGFDLDGTLAVYKGWKPSGVIGDPIPLMVAQLRAEQADGYEIRIFTARVSSGDGARSAFEVLNQRITVENWCLRNLGQVFRVTCEKDFQMVKLYDDRCVHVEFNTGRILG